MQRSHTGSRRSAGKSTGTNIVAAVGLVFIAGYSGLLVWAMNHTPYDEWGALVIGPILFALTAPVLIYLGQREANPQLVRLLLLALVAKFMGTFARYYVGYEIYGSHDARGYIEFGSRFIEPFRSGNFDVDVERGRFVGTGFVRYLTGIVMAITGDTAMGAFLVFSWIGFLGLLFFFLAFRTAFPDGKHQRYAILVFFMPSLVYWPSSVGKDAWMLLGLGLGVYGAALALRRQPVGYFLLVLGVAATSLVRPHIAALLCAGFVTAYAFRPGTKTLLTGKLGKSLGLVILTTAMLFVVQQAEEYFGVDEDGGEEEESSGVTSSVGRVLDEAERRTATGGSEFEAQRPSNPLEFPQAAFSVLFRPLLHEAHNKQALLSSLEGLVLMALFFWQIPQLKRLPRQVFKRPYLMLILVYATLFIVAFSSFGNFGILVRQRIQLLPFVLMLLALPLTNREGLSSVEVQADTRLVGLGSKP